MVEAAVEAVPESGSVMLSSSRKLLATRARKVNPVLAASSVPNEGALFARYLLTGFAANSASSVVLSAPIANRSQPKQVFPAAR